MVPELASGKLEILDSEWLTLGVQAGGVFWIDAKPRLPQSYLEELIQQIDPMYDIPGSH